MGMVTTSLAATVPAPGFSIASTPRHVTTQQACINTRAAAYAPGHTNATAAPQCYPRAPRLATLQAADLHRRSCSALPPRAAPSRSNRSARFHGTERTHVYCGYYSFPGSTHFCWLPNQTAKKLGSAHSNQLNPLSKHTLGFSYELGLEIYRF
jgi:hypothetical protein